jgi:hypothetical protein
MFDQDRPRAREKATVQRLLRGVKDPNQVFVVLECESVEDAQQARRRLVDSGVLDRFDDVHGPNVVVEAPRSQASAAAAGPVRRPCQQGPWAGSSMPSARARRRAGAGS